MTWVDPLTELERWFSNLPNQGFGHIGEFCHCGSGMPYIYWSKEESWACEDCCHSYSVYMPTAVMWNIAKKFGIPDEIMRPIYKEIEAQKPRRENDTGRT